MKKRNIISTLLLSSLLLIPGCNMNKMNDNNSISSQLESKIFENGINIKSVKDVTTSATYGAKQFNYEVYPSNYNGSINYSLTFADGTTPANNVLKVIHNEDDHTFTIECNNVFTSQATLKIYSVLNPSVYANVLIDFTEKITVDSTMVCNEGSIIKFNSNVSGTGGTILANKTITNTTYNYSDSFKNKVKDIYASNLGYNSYSELESYCASMNYELVLIGFEDGYVSAGIESINYLNLYSDEEVFNTNQFVNGFYVYIIERKGVTWNTIEYSFLSDTNNLESNLDSIFTDCIEYSVIVNGETYTKYFSLDLDFSFLEPSLISTEVDNITF